MTCQLDHVNVSVLDLERSVDFLRIAFPEFRVRGGGHGTWEGGTSDWLHLGIDELYVSLNTTSQMKEPGLPSQEQTRINHVGFIVEDVADLHARYSAAGYQTQLIDELPSRRRLYVTDADNLMWEFVQYMSDDFAVRNDYSI